MAKLPASAPPLADSIDAELRRRLPEGQRPKYRLREATNVVYAADDKVANEGRASDVSSGRAWKLIRRPSDMVSADRTVGRWDRADANSVLGCVGRLPQTDARAPTAGQGGQGVWQGVCSR